MSGRVTQHSATPANIWLFSTEWPAPGPTHQVAPDVSHTADTVEKLARLHGLECQQVYAAMKGTEV